MLPLLDGIDGDSGSGAGAAPFLLSMKTHCCCGDDSSSPSSAPFFISVATAAISMDKRSEQPCSRERERASLLSMYFLC